MQTHKEHDNSLNPRTIGALALHPTGNVQGGYFSLSLTMGKVINQMHWTTLPMPKDVIDHVKRMARQEHTGTTLLFEDRNHNEIIDLDHEDDDDSAYEPDNEDDNDDDDDDNDDDNNIPINQPNGAHNDPGILGEQDAQKDDNEEDNNENKVETNYNDNDSNEDENANTHDNDGYVEPVDTNDNAFESVHAEETEETMNHNPGGTTGVESSPLIQVQNDRTQCELNWIAWMGQQPATFAGHTQAQSRANATTKVTTEQNTMTEFEQDLFHRWVAGIQLPPEYEDQLATLKHTVLTQNTLKKGLQVFGPKGTEAVFSEMKQLHDRNACEPVHVKDLSREQKSKALG